jgi:hypothetical protein
VLIIIASLTRFLSMQQEDDIFNESYDGEHQ